MSKLKTLIRDGDFLWKPFIGEDGKTYAEGPYCVDCRVLLKENLQRIDEGVYIANGAYCVKCGKHFDIAEELVDYPFAERHDDFLLKLASKELKNYRVVTLDDLPEKEETDTKELLN